MPIKMVICSICGKEVSKRQTLHLGDNKRACREHMETQSAADDMRAGEKFAKEKEREKWSKKKHHREETTTLKPRCWVCNQEGMRQQEYFGRFLIEQKKYEIIHGRPHNPFDAQEVSQAIGSLQGERCLWYVKWHGENTKIHVPKQCYDTIVIAQQMFGEGILLVCDECCKKLKFKTMSEEKNDAMDTEAFWDMLMKHAAVYEVFVDPVMGAIAQQEMQEAN